MKFINVLARVTWLLLTDGIVSYRRLQREFDLDSDALEDVRRELIQMKCWAIDRDGEFLVWVGRLCPGKVMGNPSRTLSLTNHPPQQLQQRQ
jgi:hypothetical protein